MKIPQSIGVIPDGNRRWAKERGLPTIEGHRKGVSRFKEIGEWCIEKNIPNLTVFGFSSENKNRSQEEIDYLTEIIISIVSEKNIADLNKKGARISIAGDLSFFPEKMRKAVDAAEKKTQENKKININIALNYGGRDEIVLAAKKISEKGEPFTEESFSKNLSIKTFPDLVIRTGKEVRVSNFMIWQTAYSEFYFSDKYWPDFDKEEFDYALEYYAKKERRFGH